MKNLMLFCMIMGFGFTGMTQDKLEKTTVQIFSDSELTITGDTNINKFKCEFDTAMLEGSKEIKFQTSNSKVIFQDAILILNNRGFDCGSKPINKDFHALLQTEKYPEIALELLEVNKKDNHLAIATVKISIAGKHKNYNLPVEVRNEPVDCFIGHLKLDINDFDLKPPKKMFGLIVVKEKIEINFNLTVKNQSNELSAQNR